jgi:hypothetical protein
MLQARVMKQVLAKDQEADEVEKEEERAVLGSLRTHGKKTQKVGSVRVGAAKKAENPGTFAIPATAATGGNKLQFQIFTVRKKNVDKLAKSKIPIICDRTRSYIFSVSH